MLIISRSTLSSRVFIYIHAHEPAMTSLVEATAGLRHREVLAQAEAHVEATHTAKTEEFMEVLRVREGIESQRARDAIMFNENEINRFGFQFRENIKHEAQEHVRFREIQTNEEIQAYQKVIDANHRQSLSSTEREIVDLKRQAEEERRVQNDRIAQLEQMVQFQTPSQTARYDRLPACSGTSAADCGDCYSYVTCRDFCVFNLCISGRICGSHLKGSACCTAADNPSDEVKCWMKGTMRLDYILILIQDFPQDQSISRGNQALRSHQNQDVLREEWPPLFSDPMMQGQKHGTLLLLQRSNTHRLT